MRSSEIFRSTLRFSRMKTGKVFSILFRQTAERVPYKKKQTLFAFNKMKHNLNCVTFSFDRCNW